MALPGWLNSVLSIFGMGDNGDGVSVSVSVPFGGAPANAPDQPLEIPDNVKKQGWSKDIHDCHQKIRDAWPTVKSAWESRHPGWTLKCDYTYRSPEFQFDLYKKGRHLEGDKWVPNDPIHKTGIVTDKDGKSPSHHNVYPAQAADVYIVGADGKIIWESQPLYTELGQLWVAKGLISGATWKYSWKDWDHVQVDYPIV